MGPEKLELERFFARHSRVMRFPLGAADCESMSVGDLLAFEDGSTLALKELWLGYSEKPGSPMLRGAISDLYDQIHPDEILVTCGAREALYITLTALLGAGDHVVIQKPCYQFFSAISQKQGAEISSWTAQPEKKWAPDLDDLKSLLRPNTRLLILNTPHNPTGFHFSRDQVDAIIALAAVNGTYVLCDEILRGLELDSQRRLPGIVDLYDKGITIGGLSKAFAVPGLRIGWVITRNPDVRDRLAQLKDYTTCTAPVMSEFLATVALRHAEDLYERNREVLKANLTVMRLFAARNRSWLHWIPPLAGSVSLAQLTNIDTAYPYCEALAERSGVALAPGNCFDITGNWVRIGFGRADLPNSLAAWEDTIGNELL